MLDCRQVLSNLPFIFGEEDKIKMEEINARRMTNVGQWTVNNHNHIINANYQAKARQNNNFRFVQFIFSK